MRRGRSLRVVAVWGIGIFCSLLVSAFGVDAETQEVRVAIEALRKENAELRKMEAVHQREIGSLTNEIARLQVRLGNPRVGLVADDDEARTAADWKSFLHNALAVLADADREMQDLRKRLRLLVFASQETFRSAEGVDPAKRSLLEGELRQSRKVLGEGEDARVFAPEHETPPLDNIKVVGVKLDLGVVALAVGRNQGVRVGMPFVILRGKEMVATVTLVEVREKASLGLIEKMDSNRPVREGDLAALRRT